MEHKLWGSGRYCHLSVCTILRYWLELIKLSSHHANYFTRAIIKSLNKKELSHRDCLQALTWAWSLMYLKAITIISDLQTHS